MDRTQLNINIDPGLLQQLKRAAIRSGKTTTEFVSESITNQLEQDSLAETLDSRVLSLEVRLSLLEENSRKSSVDQKIIP